MIADGHVRLSQGPKENLTRPAVDPLFRSAALAFGPRVVGVVLTGELDDGTAGLQMLKRGGCSSIAQDEASCVVFGMPKEAIALGGVDEVLPLQRMAECIRGFDQRG